MRLPQILIRAAATSALALTVAGCAPMAGTVQDKGMIPAHDAGSFQCVSFNAQGMCTVNMYVSNWVEDDWRLYLVNDKGDKGWKSTTKEFYDYVQVGDFVDFESKTHRRAE